MTSHRTSDDSTFDSHLASLASNDNLAAKLVTYQSLKSALASERNSVIATQSEQLFTHQSKVDAMITDLKTLQQFENAGGTIKIPVGKKVYVDASASATLANGSKEKPYPTLTSALDAKCAVGDTVTRIFKLAAGTYTCARSITKTQDQDIAIVGAGIGQTIIQSGADFAAGKDTDCLMLQNFRDIKIRDLTVRFAKYGLRLKQPKGSVKIERVRFQNCGSAGITADHDASKSQVDQASVWSGSNTSDGGSIRLDGGADTKKVTITDCELYRCLRGVRVGDCLRGGLIQGNYIEQPLESGLYLSSGAYDGSGGCKGFVVQSNKVLGAANCSIMSIGGRNNQIKANTCRDGWNAGVQLHHVSETVVEENTIDNCNRKLWNGIGVQGDSTAQIAVAGNTSIDTGTVYQCRISHNNITRPNDGMAGSKVGISIQNAAYANGNRLFIQENYSEGCDTHFVKVNGGVTVVDQETRVSGGGMTFEGDKDAPSTAWRYDSNPPSVPNDKWFLYSEYLGDRENVSIKFWLDDPNGYRSIILKYQSEFLKHATIDVDFYWDNPTILNAGNRDCFYGGHHRYAAKIGRNGDAFTVYNGSHNNGDILVVRFNADTTSDDLDSYVWLNVTVRHANKRYYYQAFS